MVLFNECNQSMNNKYLVGLKLLFGIIILIFLICSHSGTKIIEITVLELQYY